MSLELTQSQTSTIKAIAENEGIYSYKLDVQPLTLEGDGYSGFVWAVTLKSEDKTLQLVLKVAEPTTNEALRIFRRQSYLREIYVYSNVLREFETFQRESNVLGGFSGFAKMYGSNDSENNEYLILENLKQSGYKMWNRKVPMNKEHVGLVFSEYGKFHAVSLAMKEKRPDTYRELARHLGDFYCSSRPREEASLTIRNILKNGFKAVKGNDIAARSFKKFTDVVEKFLFEDLEVFEDKLVVAHLDCWCNNLLFEYEDGDNLQKPKKVCFVDWQLSKLGSPVLDLAYFFFVCAAGETLWDYKKYLIIYHEVVTEALTKFSCDAEKVFPFTLLEYHWKTYAKFGLFAILMTINLMLFDSEDGSRDFQDKESDRDSNNITDCDQRILDAIRVMAENDLI